jgi:hypothetical protein
MRDSGKYTAEQVEDAFKKAQDAADKALGINTEAIKKLKAEYDTLNKQVEGEAAEADMGVNEKRARERMAQIEQEMKAEQDRIDAIRQKSAEETAKVTGEATGKAVGDALKDVFTGADKWQTFYGDDFHKNTDDAVAYTTDQFDSAAKDVQDKFDGIEIRIPIHFDYDDVVMPNGLRPGEQPEPMALGGVGHADGPMSFTTQGNEDFAFSGEGKSFSDMSGGGSKGPYTIQINVGGTMVKEVVMDELEATPTSRDVKVFSGLSRAAGRR